MAKLPALGVRGYAAIVAGIAIFFASWGAELGCGVYSEKCTVDWSGFYGPNVVFYHINRCLSPPSPSSGLGISLLSVSSLFLALPIFYAAWTTKFTVAVSFTLGVGSFLYHANNNTASGTVDYLGIVLLGPAILVDIWGVSTGRVATKVALILGFAAVTAVSIAIRVTETYHKTLDLYIYVSQGIAAFAIICILWSQKAGRERYYPGLAVLLSGIIALIVATGTREDCVGVETEFERPHFYGHLLVGAGTTAIGAAVFGADQGYVWTPVSLDG